MDWHSILEAVANLSSVVQLLAIALPIITSIAAYLYVRCNHQRRYLRAAHRLPSFRSYLQKRRKAFRALDVPVQMKLEEMEAWIASELKLDIRPQSAWLTSYLNPADRGFLKQATRQLADSVFVSFADDLIQRQMLLLDAQVDLANQRRNIRYAENQAVAYRHIEELRQRVSEDSQQVNSHVRMMKRYLSGKLDVDLYQDQTSTMLRTLLNEKYSAYSALLLQDEEVGVG